MNIHVYNVNLGAVTILIPFDMTAMSRLQKIFPDMVSTVPQSKPLSAGETLGCTAPLIRNADCLIFVADGRFHLEAGEMDLNAIFCSGTDN